MRRTDHPQSLPAELQTFREACPLLETCIYLANCSQGPQSLPVRAAIEAFLNDWARLGMHWDAWVTEVELARAAFAALIGAEPGEIAVGSSVSQLASSVASALVKSPTLTRRRIVSSIAEFPGVAHAWLATQARGYHVDLLPGSDKGLVETHHFVTAVDETTMLVSAPHVCYANGLMLDLNAIIAAAHAKGSLVFVDAYQSAGTVPIDVKASGVDFLAAGTLKYLAGTAGIAFLYVNRAVLEQLEPTVTGWFGRVDPFAFNPAQLDYAARAARFDLGTPPLINAYAARAGIELVMAAGVERIRRQLERLSELAYRLASESGLHVIGSQHIQQRGAMTAIDAGSPENAHRLEEELRPRSIIVSARGRAIRLAPHGFTREEEMEQAIDAVAELLRS
ncbi:MAG TPA: aminotransferase class V-fold PLP-dependent enzyme [Ktedonobacteraceae bacterium]